VLVEAGVGQGQANRTCGPHDPVVPPQPYVAAVTAAAAVAIIALAGIHITSLTRKNQDP
jgi:hypothetical protein